MKLAVQDGGFAPNRFLSTMIGSMSAYSNLLKSAEFAVMEQELDNLCQQLAKVYIAQGSPDRNAFVDQVSARLQALLPEAENRPVAAAPEVPIGEIQPIDPSPELIEWARQQFNPEELAEAVREIETTGGLKLSDFIHELERIAAGHE